MNATLAALAKQKCEYEGCLEPVTHADCDVFEVRPEAEDGFRYIDAGKRHYWCDKHYQPAMRTWLPETLSFIAETGIIPGVAEERVRQSLRVWEESTGRTRP